MVWNVKLKGYKMFLVFLCIDGYKHLVHWCKQYYILLDLTGLCMQSDTFLHIKEGLKIRNKMVLTKCLHACSQSIEDAQTFTQWVRAPPTSHCRQVVRRKKHLEEAVKRLALNKCLQAPCVQTQCTEYIGQRCQHFSCCRNLQDICGRDLNT